MAILKITDHKCAESFSLIAEKKANDIASIDNPQSIESLFPDEQLAMYVRDTLGKSSISDLVTQEELDTIKEAEFSHDFLGNYFPVDLTGISYLRNLTFLDFSFREDIYSMLNQIIFPGI